MPFTLTSSEWAEEIDGFGDVPEEPWVYQAYAKLTQDILMAALDSLDTNRSVVFHPRATLEYDERGQQLTLYRSGRMEWNGSNVLPGYDRKAAQLFIPRQNALDLWNALLRGDLPAIESLPWSHAADTHCHVCGYDLGFAPWGQSGDCPSYDICHCCGCEFGVHDTSAEQIRAVRADWIAKGSGWFWPTSRPSQWNAQSQLGNVPTDFWRAW